MQQKFFFHTFPYPQGRNSIEQKWILISYWDFLWENLTSLTIRKFSRLLAQFFFILSFWYSVHVLFKSYAMQNPCSFDYNDSILNLKQQRSVSKQKNQTFLVLVNEKSFGSKVFIIIEKFSKKWWKQKLWTECTKMSDWLACWPSFLEECVPQILSSTPGQLGQLRQLKLKTQFSSHVTISFYRLVGTMSMYKRRSDCLTQRILQVSLSSAPQTCLRGRSFHLSNSRRRVMVSAIPLTSVWPITSTRSKRYTV